MLKTYHLGILNSFYLFTLILFLFHPNILSQSKDKTTKWPEPKFEHITVENGLPVNNVLCMLQDHLGFIWLGTINGLVKYDGYMMTVYQHDPNNPKSISYNRINAIYEDKSGTLWVGTGEGKFGGLNRFNRATETFYYYTNNPSDTNSISSNMVHCIYEDSKERLWIGTEMGLNLLDRNTGRFKHYYYQEIELNEEVYKLLSKLRQNGKTIQSILQVGNNANLKSEFTLTKPTPIVCVIMGEGMQDYGWLENESGKRIIQYNPDLSFSAGGANAGSGNKIQIVKTIIPAGKYFIRFVSDSSHSYNDWLSLPDSSFKVLPAHPEHWGIQVFSLEDEKLDIEAYMKLQNKINRSDYQIVYAITQDKITGELLVSGSPGIWRFDEKYRIISKIETSEWIYNIKTFYQTDDGNIWCGSSRSLVRFTRYNRDVKSFNLAPSKQYVPENDSRTSIVEVDGLIWCGTHGGALVCVDPNTEQFKVYSNNPDDPQSLGISGTGTVTSIMKDRSGILWVGTSEHGLEKWDKGKLKFNSYYLDEKIFPGNLVTTMCETRQGKVLIGTTGGRIATFDREKNDLIPYAQNQIKTGRFGSNDIININEDPSDAGILWIASDGEGLFRYDSNVDRLVNYLNDSQNENSLSSNSVSFTFADTENILWVCTRAGGLNKLNRKTGKFLRYLYDPLDSNSISSNDAWYCFKDRSGEFWVVTMNINPLKLAGAYRWEKYQGYSGLNLYDYKTGRFKFYISLSEEIDLSSVTSICEDHSGNFWVGDYINGLYLFDRKKGKYALNFTMNDGLANNQVMSILEDDSGDLWISTYKGLSRFDPVTKSFRNYYKEDGLSSNKFFFRSAFKSKNGEMFFGGENGFTWFNPENIKDDPVPPLVAIINLSLFNRPDEKLEINGFISEMEGIELSYNQNDLRFDYVGLHFGEPSKNKYKYMLENFDKDWVDAGTQRNATYTNLDAGEYIFRVKAANHDGVWNEEGKSLKVIIHPPFWATWWAYGFYFLFGLSIFYSIRKYEMNRLKLKNQVKLDEVVLKEREETDKMKSRFFANISHEFRTPLTLILGPAEKIIANFKDDEIQKQTGLIKRNAVRLLGLINQLLDLSKLEAGKLQLKASPGNIVSFVKGITMSFESLAERKDIALKVKSERVEIEVYFDRNMMAKILSNLLSNAFKFTPEGGEIIVFVTSSHAELVSASSLAVKIPKQVRNDVMGDFIQIIVKDTGIGISEEELPKLFDRFYQVDSSQTREYEGSGLGLALTKELVELHCGTIKVESKKGGGSEVILKLPLGRNHLRDDDIVSEQTTLTQLNIVDQVEQSHFDRLSVTDKDQAIEARDVDKTIILVVEDNADVREYIKDSLGNEFIIEEAANGEQGIRKAEQIIPDLIISDIMMPKMDGNELARRIKNDEKTSHIPIILLTAKSEQESRLEGLETGADDYLTKPFDTQELLIRIRNLITIRRKLQEKFSGGKIIAKKNEKKLSSIDEKFLNKVLEVVENHLSKEEFSIEEFSDEVGMSRVQLHRKLKALTGKSASIYLRSVRLSKAKNMIEEKKGNISEIAYSVGFSSPAYFSACFKEEFGHPPSEAPH